MFFNGHDPVMQRIEESARFLFKTVLELQLNQLLEEPKIHLKGFSNLKVEKHRSL